MNLKQIAYEDGYDKGEATGRAEFVLSMFNSGKTPEQISDFCGLDLDYHPEYSVKSIK